MSGAFDPYHRWLGIPPGDRPLNHYRLLGLQLFEADVEVIRDAAERQMGHVRQYQLGQHAELTQKVLNELATAKGCLLDADRKKAYDAQLRSEKAAKRPQLLRAVPLEEPLAQPPALPPELPPLPEAVILPPLPDESVLAGQVALAGARKRPSARTVALGVAVATGVLVLSALAWSLHRRGGEKPPAERQVASRPAVASSSSENPAAPVIPAPPAPVPSPAETKPALPKEPVQQTPSAPINPQAAVVKPAEPPSLKPAEPTMPKPAEPPSLKPAEPPLPTPAEPATPKPAEPSAEAKMDAGSAKPAAAASMPALEPGDEVGKHVHDAFKLIESGANPAAYEILKDTVKIDRQDVRPEFLLGLMEALAGAKPDSALKRFDHCLEKQPGDPALLNNYALVSVRLKLYPQAIRSWKKAVEAGPVLPEIVQNTGRMSWLVGKAFKLDSRAQESLLELVGRTAGGGQSAYDSGIGWLYSSSPVKGKPVPKMESKAYEDVRCPICFGSGRVDCPNRYCKNGKVSRRLAGNEFRSPSAGGPRIRSDQTVFVSDPRCGGRGWVGCAACEGNPGDPNCDYIRPGSGIQPGLTPPRGFQKTGDMKPSEP